MFETARVVFLIGLGFAALVFLSLWFVPRPRQRYYYRPGETCERCGETCADGVRCAACRKDAA